MLKQNLEKVFNLLNTSQELNVKLKEDLKDANDEIDILSGKIEYLEKQRVALAQKLERSESYIKGLEDELDDVYDTVSDDEDEYRRHNG